MRGISRAPVDLRNQKKHEEIRRFGRRRKTGCRMCNIGLELRAQKT